MTVPASRGGRAARWAVIGAVTTSALVVGALAPWAATSSAAVRCRSAAGVRSFTGFVRTTFRATATGSDSRGGTATVTLRHTGDLIVKRIVPVPGSRGAGFSGVVKRGSGQGTAQDVYTGRTYGGDKITGTQTGRGGLQTGGITIAFLGCRYLVRLTYGVPTTNSGDWPPSSSQGGPGADRGVADIATSPLRPVPPGLVLRGSATVPAYCGGAPRGAGYVFGGLQPGNDTWGSELCTLANASTSRPVGKAVISWGLSP